MNNPFWEAMVRTRASAYEARALFDNISIEREPVWCFSRFGQSITRLPDGRYVEIAGEHEDFYDPDFCIYNDVVIHHGDNTFDILGYPEEEFPFTDFHSATFVPPFIYIIGNLGYVHQRRPGDTPVYRLHTESWKIEKIKCTGSNPGWIHKHRAILIGQQQIEIIGGLIDVESGAEFVDSELRYILDLESFEWRSA